MVKKLNEEEFSKLKNARKIDGPLEKKMIDNGSSIFQMFWSDKRANRKLQEEIQKYATKKGCDYYREEGFGTDFENGLCCWCEFYRSK